MSIELVKNLTKIPLQKGVAWYFSSVDKIEERELLLVLRLILRIKQ
jgi:hypothetical protein